MFFTATLTIPSKTYQATPKRKSIRVTEGVVRRVWVRWRWGTGGLCGVRMRYREYVHWPLSQQEWFPSTPDPLEFADSFKLSDIPSTIVLEGFNIDDTFPHTVWVAFEIERPAISEAMRGFLQDVDGGINYG